MKDHIALITGGLGDLGHAMAFHLAKQGAQVVVWDLAQKNDPSTQEKLKALKVGRKTAFYQRVDVSNRKQVDQAIDQIIAKFGRLTLVCSNAGIVESAPFLQITQAQWQRHQDVNLTGCFNVGQASARKMVELGIAGRIIFTSTWVAQIPWPEITAYTASKAGVNMLMKQMARELAAHGIKVNAIAPGIVKAGLAGRQLVEEPQYAARVSKVIPLGQPGTPDEIAQAVVYLASPQTEYMTGSLLTLDGGCSLFQFDS
jgi:NAD(P)-dependent dehydrogenase (short-subunit alcohol dehydrogenase family)